MNTVLICQNLPRLFVVQLPSSAAAPQKFTAAPQRPKFCRLTPSLANSITNFRQLRGSAKTRPDLFESFDALKRKGQSVRLQKRCFCRSSFLL